MHGSDLELQDLVALFTTSSSCNTRNQYTARAPSNRRDMVAINFNIMAPGLYIAHPLDTDTYINHGESPNFCSSSRTYAGPTTFYAFLRSICSQPTWVHNLRVRIRASPSAFSLKKTKTQFWHAACHGNQERHRN